MIQQKFYEENPSLKKPSKVELKRDKKKASLNKKSSKKLRNVDFVTNDEPSPETVAKELVTKFSNQPANQQGTMKKSDSNIQQSSKKNTPREQHEPYQQKKQSSIGVSSQKKRNDETITFSDTEISDVDSDEDSPEDQPRKRQKLKHTSIHCNNK